MLLSEARTIREYTDILVDTDTPLDLYTETRERLFALLDSFCEQDRNEHIVRSYPHLSGDYNESHFDLHYLPSYFVPRMVDGRITKESFSTSLKQRDTP